MADQQQAPSEFAEKVRSIGTSFKKGTTKKVPVLDDRTGKVGGHHVEHWDGSQDAVITPQTVGTRARVKEGLA